MLIVPSDPGNWNTGDSHINSLGEENCTCFKEIVSCNIVWSVLTKAGSQCVKLLNVVKSHAGFLQKSSLLCILGRWWVEYFSLCQFLLSFVCFKNTLKHAKEIFPELGSCCAEACLFLKGIRNFHTLVLKGQMEVILWCPRCRCTALLL